MDRIVCPVAAAVAGRTAAQRFLEIICVARCYGSYSSLASSREVFFRLGVCRRRWSLVVFHGLEKRFTLDL
jgi:hypothetical protein